MFVASAVVLGSSSVRADYIYDVHEINKLLFTGASHNATFDLTDQGVPDSLTVYSATVAFGFMNLGGEVQEVEVLLDGSTTSLDSGQFGMFFALWGDVSGSIIATLNQTGMLDYSVEYNGDNAVWLMTAGIAAEVGQNAPASSVPDGGSTLFLLGAGVVCAGFLSRRRASS